jgi:hypothetical protein
MERNERIALKRTAGIAALEFLAVIAPDSLMR